MRRRQRFKQSPVSVERQAVVSQHTPQVYSTWGWNAALEQSTCLDAGDALTTVDAAAKWHHLMSRDFEPCRHSL